MMWQTDGWAVAVAVYSIFFKQAESCYPWGLDSSNSSWLDSRESKLVLAHRVGTLTQLVLIKSAKIEIFHSLLYLMVFINKYILLSFPFTYGVSCLSGWSIVLMHITWMVKSCLCYFRSGRKQLFGKVRIFGTSVHTLIHPPSQCGCCVEQLELER